MLFNPEIHFIPGEGLLRTPLTTLVRCPTEPVSQEPKGLRYAQVLTSTFYKNSSPDLFVQRTIYTTRVQASLPNPDGAKRSALTCGTLASPRSSDAEQL
eukprot:1246145-Amphidinium_carterae.2